MVMGATNRREDIDQAFMRRLPKQFPIGRPDASQRRSILNKILKDSKLDEDDFDLEAIVSNTRSFSGSDLKELCREAALNSMREFIRDNYKDGKKLTKDTEPESTPKVRPLRTSDFLKGFSETIPSSTVDWYELEPYIYVIYNLFIDCIEIWWVLPASINSTSPLWKKLYTSSY